MSLRNTSSTAIISRTVGLGHTIMFWLRVNSYPSADIWSVFHSDVNFDTPNIGSVVTNTSLEINSTPSGVGNVIATGSNTNWFFVCLIADDTTQLNYQCYWRAEGEAVLHSGTMGVKSAGGLVKFYLLNNPPTSRNVDCQITAYKEWTNYNDLGLGTALAANVLTESKSLTVVNTTNNCNYMSCQSGTTIGDDTSASNNDWTVSGSFAFDSAEPVMGIVSITSQPSNASVLLGTTATFTVVGSAASGSLSYQWKLNGVNVSGGSGNTSASYTTPTLAMSDNGNLYTCVVTDALGSITSNQALLNVVFVTSLFWVQSNFGTLIGSSTSSAATVALDSIGTTDWIKWEDTTTRVRKSGGGSLISNYSLIGGTSDNNYTNDPRTLSWTGGTPTASGSSTKGVYMTPETVGLGFTFTVPADNTVRTLHFYGGMFDGQGSLTATLSDSSAAPITIFSATTAASASGDFNAIIVYQSFSAGQTLTLQWKFSNDLNHGGGNVTMCGAALS